MCPFQSYRTILCFLCALSGCYSLSTPHLHRRTFAKVGEIAGTTKPGLTPLELKPIDLLPASDPKALVPQSTNTLPADYLSDRTPLLLNHDSLTTKSELPSKIEDLLVRPQGEGRPQQRFPFENNAFIEAKTRGPAPGTADRAAKNRVSQVLDKFTTSVSGGIAKLWEKISQGKLWSSSSNFKFSKIPRPDKSAKIHDSYELSIVRTSENQREIEKIVGDFVHRLDMKEFRDKFTTEYQSAIKSLKDATIYPLSKPIENYFPMMQLGSKASDFPVEEFSQIRALKKDYFLKAQYNPKSSLTPEDDVKKLHHDSDLKVELFRYSMLDGLSKILSEARQYPSQALRGEMRLLPEYVRPNLEENLRDLFASTRIKDREWRESLYAKIYPDKPNPSEAFDVFKKGLEEINELGVETINSNPKKYPYFRLLNERLRLEGDKDIPHMTLDEVNQLTKTEFEDRLMTRFREILFRDTQRTTDNEEELAARTSKIFESRYFDTLDKDSWTLLHRSDDISKPDYSEFGQVFRLNQKWHFDGFDRTKAYIQAYFKVDDI